MNKPILDDKGVVLICAACGRRNRVPFARLAEAGTCGQCQSALPVPNTPLDVPGDAVFNALLAAAPLPAVEYVKDNVVTTNGLENFWSLPKRTIKGTYVTVDVPHLDAYLAEQAFRFNERKDNDAGRFVKVIGGVGGKRIIYKQLISE